MMPQDSYGNQPMAANGDDGYWPPAPDSAARSGIQQSNETGRPLAEQPGAATYPANANDNYRPTPPGDVGGGQPQQPGKSTTLLDIIMGNSQ
jgi:penicillin-binding protein 1A